MFTDTLDILDVWLRLLAAIACGGVLGWEREGANKSAGFRTHILVALGSASFTIVALQLYAQNTRHASLNPGDPTRAIQGVITGIGFLGAGAILRGRHGVHGLTTAASIWVVGALGAACGAGLYQIAALVTVHALIILAIIRIWPEHGNRRVDKIRNGADDGPDEDDDDGDDQIPSLPTG